VARLGASQDLQGYLDSSRALVEQVLELLDPVAHQSIVAQAETALRHWERITERQGAEEAHVRRQITKS
jgi:hypothetical protein